MDLKCSALRKLVLNRETIASLTELELGLVRGGGPNDADPNLEQPKKATVSCKTTDPGLLGCLLNPTGTNQPASQKAC